ncbi:uncharacterized protein LOC9628878 isoform X2 [Selaginella moellendorffii]|uniref:uncharacterized protein LOC9628878 isoform X2 n=1 Tax=Selaginella moellendorffii TaxID=88036 RepID=UPI000D1CF1B1|nr:uncharacterized protein LOC9628878 isoform X2 [Selaginella moellendorffii]|eukprot:XP_024517079.1 uncharacterized protein LOC9628878 isoform X2 [Selaginella moellendorffii]
MASLCPNFSCSRLRFPARRRRGTIPVAAIAQQQPPDRLSAQEFFEAFLRSRRGNVDFISRASDILWKKELQEEDEAKLEQIRTRLAEKQKMDDDSSEGGGFLRLSQAKNWSLGLDSTAPANYNQKLLEAEKERDDFRRKCLLDYEALKRELSLVTLGVGLVTGVYCLAFLSTETAVSYEIGVFGSWVYLQLLANQVDKTSELTVPQIFTQRKRRKTIGFTSNDLRDSVEKNLQGIRFALSSPRLLLVVAFYGVWLGSSQLGQDLPFKLEIAPMLLGFFAYKAAALVQAYRDNKDLLITFPANSSDKEELDREDGY